MAVELTLDQRTAVENRGGSLLVSAAAGSGKTKVLVERLFRYIMEEQCAVDDFLIITYTKAAAAELRGKIAAELSKRVAEHPDNAHLRRQLFRVYQADIKTVDAFCAALLRENVYRLPPVAGHTLTPDFRVLDEQEAAMVKERVLERTLEDFYAGMDDQRRQLAETLGAGRDDRALEQLVLELHRKLQSHPYPLEWLEKVRRGWETLPEDLSRLRRLERHGRRAARLPPPHGRCPGREPGKGARAGHRQAVQGRPEEAGRALYRHPGGASFRPVGHGARHAGADGTDR